MKRIAAALLSVSCLCKAEQPPELIAAPVSVVPSAYLDLQVDERRFPTARTGMGGAIAFDGRHLVLGTSDCRFIKIDLQTWAYVDDALPALVTGGDQLKKSKRYKTQDRSPRVVGLLAHGGAYFVTYTRYVAATDFVHFVVAKLAPGAKRWVTIYESPGLDAPYLALAEGGRMVVAGSELLFTVGDFSLDRRNGLPSDVAAQNPALPWGKVNAVDLRTGAYRVHSLGHRNPQGLALLRDGTLVATEHGPRGGDEINVIERGKNYGWPFVSDGQLYGSYRDYTSWAGFQTEGSKFTGPAYSFVPSPAVSQVIQVTEFHPKWAGDLLIGSLKAQNLYHVRFLDRRVQFAEPIPIGRRIRDLVQVGASFYALTDACTILKVSARR